jgi:tungstate transport system substrate-binding protein
MSDLGSYKILDSIVPDAEVKFMEGGHGLNRKLVMHNDYIIVGAA